MLPSLTSLFSSDQPVASSSNPDSITSTAFTSEDFISPEFGEVCISLFSLVKYIFIFFLKFLNSIAPLPRFVPPGDEHIPHDPDMIVPGSVTVSNIRPPLE
jgi:hypothetical protein